MLAGVGPHFYTDWRLFLIDSGRLSGAAGIEPPDPELRGRELDRPGPASIDQPPCRLGRPTCRGLEAIASKSSPSNIDQSISLGSSKFASS